MNRLYLSAQAYSNFMSLPQEARLFVNTALLRLRQHPEQGLRLWGREDLYLYQTARDLTIVYKPNSGGIKVVAIQLAQKYLPQRDKIAAIVLAAGKAAYGDIPTQPLPIGSVSLISRVTEALLTAGIDDLIMVLGYQAEQVKKELANKDIKIVVNPSYERGLSSSLRYGLRMVSKGTSAVMVALGNRPFIEPEVVDKLLSAYKKERAPIVAPFHCQTRGHPVIFDASLIPELLRARGNVGGREVIEHHKQELMEVAVGELVFSDE